MRILPSFLGAVLRIIVQQCYKPLAVQCLHEVSPTALAEFLKQI